MRLPLIIVAGPTAVGKSALAVRLAKAVGGEIISADSMQVYRGLDIGSAKVTDEEKQGVPHFLIDELDPKEPFDVVKFQAMAKAYIEQICARGHIPILVGGSGFYIQAVLYGIDFDETASDPSYRASLEERARLEGPEKLYGMLKEVDPASAERIHPNNQKRVIRALEFYHASGEKISEHNDREILRESPYNFVYFVLDEDRDRLYRKIDRRVDEMMERGLLREVEDLLQKGCTKETESMQGLGYQELIDYLDGGSSYEEAVRLIKRDTRHFAKRQLTWFRRERDAVWIEKEAYGNDQERILDAMLARIKERGILRDEAVYGQTEDV